MKISGRKTTPCNRVTVWCTKQGLGRAGWVQTMTSEYAAAGGTSTSPFVTEAVQANATRYNLAFEEGTESATFISAAWRTAWHEDFYFMGLSPDLPGRLDRREAHRSCVQDFDFECHQCARPMGGLSQLASPTSEPTSSVSQAPCRAAHSCASTLHRPTPCRQECAAVLIHNDPLALGNVNLALWWNLDE